MQRQHPRLATDLPPDPSGEADFLVDFGEVAIGDAATRRFSLGNDGSVVLAIESDEPAAPFSLDPASRVFRLPAGSKTEIGFRFEPTSESATPFGQLLTLATNEGSDGSAYRIRLEGASVRAALDCDPSALDFGMLVRGNASTRTVRCTNPTSFPLEVGQLPIRGTSAPYFFARIVGSSSEVAPGGVIELEVELRGEVLGTQQAELEVRADFGQPLVSLPLTAQVVTSEVSIEPAACLDFAYVQLGASARQLLSLRNLSAAPIRILAIELEGESASDFSVQTETPLLLEPDGAVEVVEIEFHPSGTGPRSAALTLQTDEVGAPPLTACAKGYGGGPALSCSQASWDFGAVAVGVPSSISLRCSNTGTAPAEGEAVPLLVSAVASDSERFRVSLRNQDGSTGPAVSGYAPGEGFFLDVVYDPVDEGFDEGELRVESNAAPVLTRVSGQGRLLPPCEISIVPPSLRFGVVAPGEELTRPFELRNLLDTACLIRDLRLSEDSSPAFSLTPIGAIELAGGGALEVPVRFAPTDLAPSLEGEVEFEVSNPDDRFRTVTLRGAAAEACLLIEPAAIDFGDVAPGCDNQGRRVVISNACAAPLTLTSARIDGPQAGDFQILRLPTLPRLLGPQQWEEAVVAFVPDRLGQHRASLELEVEGSSPGDELLYVTRLEGNGATSSRQTDEFIQEDRREIDVLWVMDNSTSMVPFQERIRENLPAFLTFANQRQVDFQIGVTTTATRFGGSGCPGGADGTENGRLFPVNGSHPRILRPETPGLEAHWRHNMMVGACFNQFGESGMEAAFRALSLPLINEVKDSRYPGGLYLDGNAGFLRPKAALSIILVSDSQDYSPQTPVEYEAFFVGLKRGNRSMVRVHGITGPPTGAPATGCGFAQKGDRMISLIEATEGTWLSICTPTDDTEAWASALEEMSSGVFNVAEPYVLRSEPADRSGSGGVDEADIEVRVGGILLPHIEPGSLRRVWSYERESNAIYFEPRYIPEAGTVITASYDLACG